MLEEQHLNNGLDFRLFFREKDGEMEEIKANVGLKKRFKAIVKQQLPLGWLI